MFEATVKIPESRVIDMLITVCENPSTVAMWVKDEYPYHQTNVYDKNAMPEYALKLPCPFEDNEDPTTEATLTMEGLKKGLQLFASGKDKNGEDIGSWHFAHFLEGQDDLTTADVFLQLCLFGEVVYC